MKVQISALLLIAVQVTVCLSKEETEDSPQPVRAEVISCGGWRLNKLPEVKKFIYEDIPLFHNVEFVKKAGALPTVALFDKDDKEYVRYTLSDMNREGLNDFFLSRGFFKKEHPDDPVPEEYAAGTKRIEL